MGEPLISVIIPVYNAEKYLDETMTPLLMLNDAAIEILLVDDGSTDNSPHVCDVYAKEDKRVKSYHTENRGVSAARNFGIERAQGTYLYFIDSDDIAEPKVLLDLVRLIEKNQCDMGIASFRTIDSDKNPLVEHINAKTEIISGEEVSRRLILWETKCVIGTFVVKRDVVESIRFTVGTKYGEDVEYIHMCMLKSRKVIISPQLLHEYRMHGESAVHKITLSRFDVCFARKRFRTFVETNCSGASELLNTIDTYSIPEGLAQTLWLMCYEGVPLREIEEFLQRTGLKNDIDCVASNEKAEERFRDILKRWQKNSRKYWLETRAEKWKYAVRSRLGRIKRRVLYRGEGA